MQLIKTFSTAALSLTFIASTAAFAAPKLQVQDTTVTTLQVDVMAEALDAAGVGHEDLVIPGGLHGSYLWQDPLVVTDVLAFLHDRIGS